MSYDAEYMCSGGDICRAANPQTCCEVLVKHITRLMPPAIVDKKFPIKVERRIDVRVKKVCPEKVIIAGIIHKKLTYKSIDRCGKIRNSRMFDNVKFNCIIDREDANAGDEFQVVGAGILCIVCEEPESASLSSKNYYFEEACKFIEEDIVKVCIRKKT